MRGVEEGELLHLSMRRGQALAELWRRARENSLKLEPFLLSELLNGLGKKGLKNTYKKTFVT